MIKKDLLCKISPDVVIYKILSFIEYELKTFNVKDLYGYFKGDCVKYPVWSNIRINDKLIKKLESYLCMTSLSLHFNNKISELIEYSLLTSLTLESCYDITELVEYPLLTSLTLWNWISELKEYPLLSSLTLRYC